MKVYNPLVFMLVLCCLIGCSIDNIEIDDIDEDNKSIADPPPEENKQVPTITIEERPKDPDKGTIKWRLNATPPPQTDLAVITRLQTNDNIVHRQWWVVIPRFKSSSSEFNETLRRAGKIQIHPLPTISIVGKGVVVDLETLQKPLPTKTRGGHIIPKDYDFPLYKVGEPSHISIKADAVEAKFRSSIPPDGGVLAVNASLVLTFSATPQNVTVNGKPTTVVGNTATLAGPHRPGQTAFAIAWDNGPGGAAGRATINLNVVAPDNRAPTIVSRNFRLKDADPEPLNRNGVIIEFSEPIAKHSLKLTLEDGTDLGWLPRVSGTKITFRPLRGKELGNETTYIVQGEVFDAAGNKTFVKVTFVTRLKE